MVKDPELSLQSLDETSKRNMPPYFLTSDFNCLDPRSINVRANSQQESFNLCQNELKEVMDFASQKGQA